MTNSKIDMVKDEKYNVNWFFKNYLQNNDMYILR